MNIDPYRLILGCMILVFVPWAATYRARTLVQPEKLDRTQEGWPILLTLRPLGLLTMAIVVAWFLHPSWIDRVTLDLPALFRWPGLVIVAAGMLLVLWTFKTLGSNLTDTVVTRKDHALITHGPYVYFRHPFYNAVALMVLGISITTANWLIFVLGSGAIACLLLRTPIEERFLLARFGDDYRALMNRTPRFGPRLGR